MADRETYPSRSMTIGLKTIEGVIKVVGAASAANNVVTLDLGGHGVATVARTNTGEYTITLSDKYVGLVGAFFQMFAATAIDLVAQGVSHDVAGAKTIVFKTLAGASATDTANGVTHNIHFRILLKDTQVPR